MIVGFIRVEPGAVPGVTLNNVTLSRPVLGDTAQLDESDRNQDGDFNLDSRVTATSISVQGQVNTVIDRPATVQFFISPSEIRFPRLQRIEQEVQITTSEDGDIDCSAVLPPIGLRGLPKSRCL